MSWVGSYAGSLMGRKPLLVMLDTAQLVTLDPPS
jgi:hypothetical protein